MKKLISLLLVMMMVASLSIAVFADALPANGSITINGTSFGNTYEIYKILDLESYDTASGAYSYKVTSAWTNFFKAGTGALDYMSVSDNGYATWYGADDDDRVAAFAKLALAYAKANGIAPVKSTLKDGDYSVKGTAIIFSGLELGYYLIDSTMGALCGLTTTNPAASINAKNASPTIDKQVQEDSTNQWTETNTADIGQTVNFRTTINVHAGAQNYVLHDKMSSGLTFQSITKIEHVIPGGNADGSNKVTTVPAEYYTVVTEPLTEGMTVGLTDGCTFEVRFTQAFCDHLETNDKVIVFYDAMLNRNALVAGNGNPNETWLDYGENHHTTHDTTYTYTFGIDIIKTDSQNSLIPGAKFKIYDAAEGGNEVGVVLMDDGTTYRRARADEQAESKTVAIEVKNGKVRVVGFDNGTYYLEEVVAPSGYEKLNARQKFIISDGNLDAVFNGEIYSTGSGVHVVNKSGTMLPETGAMGTTMFITFGLVVMLGTGVLLVTKKRMSMIQD